MVKEGGGGVPRTLRGVPAPPPFPFQEALEKLCDSLEQMMDGHEVPKPRPFPLSPSPSPLPSPPRAPPPPKIQSPPPQELQDSTERALRRHLHGLME